MNRLTLGFSLGLNIVVCEHELITGQYNFSSDSYLLNCTKSHIMNNNNCKRLYKTIADKGITEVAMTEFETPSGKTLVFGKEFGEIAKTQEELINSCEMRFLFTYPFNPLGFLREHGRGDATLLIDFFIFPLLGCIIDVLVFVLVFLLPFIFSISFSIDSNDKHRVLFESYKNYIETINSDKTEDENDAEKLVILNLEQFSNVCSTVTNYFLLFICAYFNILRFLIPALFNMTSLSYNYSMFALSSVYSSKCYDNYTIDCYNTGFILVNGMVVFLYLLPFLIVGMVPNSVIMLFIFCKTPLQKEDMADNGGLNKV